MRKILHRASQLLTAAIVIFEFLFMCWLQTDISSPTPIGACPFYAVMIGHIWFLCVAGMTAIDGEYVKRKNDKRTVYISFIGFLLLSAFWELNVYWSIHGYANDSLTDILYFLAIGITVTETVTLVWNIRTQCYLTVSTFLAVAGIDTFLVSYMNALGKISFFSTTDYSINAWHCIFCYGVPVVMFVPAYIIFILFRMLAKRAERQRTTEINEE